MQIISEIAEIIASAADGGLVLYFFVSILGKRIRYDGGNM